MVSLQYSHSKYDFTYSTGSVKAEYWSGFEPRTDNFIWLAAAEL